MLIPNFKLKFKNNRILIEKSPIYCGMMGSLFSVIVPKPSSKVIRKSEIHLVIYEIAFPIKNTSKTLFEVESWLVLWSNTQKPDKKLGFSPP